MIRARYILLILSACIMAFSAGCRSPKQPVRYKYSRAPVQEKAPKKKKGLIPFFRKAGDTEKKAKAPVVEKAPEKKRGWISFLGKDGDKKKKVSASAPASPRAKVSVPVSGPSSDSSVYRVKKGDQIIIELRSIPREYEIEDMVDENGTVTLDYIGAVQVEGRTTSELERSIRKAYVDQKIYKNITVKVLLPLRSYFVRGEVRNPGRYALVSDLTLVQAMAAAGGYTEFANPKKVKVIRGESSFTENVKTLEKHPEKDVAIDAGDVIVVPRSFF